MGQEFEQDSACKDDSSVGVDKDNLGLFNWQMDWSRKSKTESFISDS